MKPGDKRGDKNPYYRVFGDKHPKSKYSNELKIKIYKFYQNILIGLLNNFNLNSKLKVTVLYVRLYEVKSYYS